ncbi:MAG: class I SAM-dependent methyltransferase [Bryobacteraceae bacterium]|nr:class I SAM-dependent methyltransferase [Bryobacteraceae bacterium]
MASIPYPGLELKLFEQAHNWKSYWSGRIAPHVRGAVLEVGAGIGANTRLLAQLDYARWTCLEPDPSLAKQIELPAGGRHEVTLGTVADLPPDQRFDAILYIDVLEHIEDDRAEMARAAARLQPGGHLMVLSPAHPFLFTPFDAAIGHFRRYTRATLRQAAPAGVCEVSVDYLDSMGVLAVLGNRLVLGQSMPNARQISVWDRWLVPPSRWTDRLTMGHLGKSVLGVWRKD